VEGEKLSLILRIALQMIATQQLFSAFSPFVSESVIQEFSWLVAYGVLAAVTVKIAVFRDMTPFSLVEVSRCCKAPDASMQIVLY